MSTFHLPFDEPGPAPAGEPERASDPRADWSVEPPLRPEADRPVSVSELTARIRGLIESAFAEVWVEGELSNCRLWNTGHLYFTLKDATAQVRAVMFRSDVRRVKFRPEDGLHVVARGRLSVYDPKGEYQIVCGQLEPRGFGALQLAFEQLKKQLQAEGLFDPARKRPLPVLPRRIGLVTSLDGAAIRDMIKVLRRRYPNAHLIISPTRVQGDGAAEEIARGLERVARVPGVDVVIVGRGGGSIEDLWAFNEERVARAIAASPVPVISAVGHESDVTIADLVADLRAPTPSAAAELVVARKDDFHAVVERQGARLRGAMQARLGRLDRRVHELMRRPAVAGWPARLALRGRHVAECAAALHQAERQIAARRGRRYQALRARLEARDLRRRLADLRHRLGGARSQLHTATARRYHRLDARFRAGAARLDTLSPLGVLGRGYAVCWNADRTAIVRDAARVAAGDRVRVTLHRGELDCEVRTKVRTKVRTNEE